jgi:hypothetical protein
MSVCTPAIIEQLGELMQIDTTREFFLVRCVKLTIEAYVEKQFDLSSFVEDMAPPLDFLRLVRFENSHIFLLFL